MSLKVHNFTKKNFELTNQRQGREIQNSKLTIFSADGAFSNQIKLDTFFTVLYYLDLKASAEAPLAKSEVVWRGLAGTPCNNILLVERF